MYMSYSKNPHLPKVRMKAVNLVIQGWSIRKVARYFGVEPSTVCRWKKKDKNNGMRPIETESSRPHSHPHALKARVVEAIVSKRREHNRCAEVVFEELKNVGIEVSLSSVRRTLDRQGLIKKRSLWKKWHFSLPRPDAINPGDLLQIDTIHIQLRDGSKFYVYTLIDLVSRWAYAKVTTKINTWESLLFVREATRRALFRFSMLQSDHGSEFSSWFTEQVSSRGTKHRHSRVRQCNDNAYVERFNRTIQEECLNKVSRNITCYKKAIRKYLPYYNGRRLHMGIKFKFPLEVLRSY